jgi:hypothetical protein
MKETAEQLAIRLGYLKHHEALQADWTKVHVLQSAVHEKPAVSDSPTPSLWDERGEWEA